MKPPSDLKVLNVIYKLYYKDFKDFSTGTENKRASKIYVPIDCKRVATKLNVDGDIVFGRLYYHLEEKYGYRNSDDSNVHFFSRQVGPDRHCVNFPLLASVLAGLREENSKFLWATLMAGIALLISIAVPVVGWLSGSSQP